LDIVLAAMNGTLADLEIEWDDQAAVCVVLASEGYPGSYPKGKVINGLAEAEAKGALVFHAGTAAANGQIVTNGGRVLGVVGLGKDIAAAREHAYEAVKSITFEGMQHRSDIAMKALV